MLSESDIETVLPAAISRWQDAGLAACSLAALKSATLVPADLSGATLGLTVGGVVYLDRQAAGHGWFVDQTPDGDEEFAPDTGGGRQAVVAQAADRIDLLTVVTHELGHIAGLEDLDLPGPDLMSRTLSDGIRRTPGPAEVDALFALEVP